MPTYPQKQTLTEILLLQLLTLIPNFSETALAPVLLTAASHWHIPVSYAEYAFSVYMAGLACGLFAWGQISDRTNHKIILTTGLLMYCAASLWCWQSTSITTFLIARFIQGFGAVCASVMSIVLARKLFPATNMRARVHSYIGLSLSLSPALGPIVGAYFTNSPDWQRLFLVLSVFVASIGLFGYYVLSKRTDNAQYNRNPNYLTIPLNWDIIALSLLAGLAISNAIVFFTLSAHYYQVIQSLSSSSYSYVFILVALSWVLGSIYSQFLIRHFGSLNAITIASIGACVTAFIGHALTYSPALQYNAFTSLSCICMIMIHTGVIIPNSITLALANQDKNVGAASSVMGFVYNMIAAIVTHLACLGPQSDVHYFHKVFVFINCVTIAILVIYRLRDRFHYATAYKP